MDTESIKYFLGDYIAPMGRPHVVIAARMVNQVFLCENFIIIERLDGTFLYKGETVRSQVIQGYCETAEDFNSQVIERSKSLIYLAASTEREKDPTKPYYYRDFNVVLRPTQEVQFWMYIRSKSVEPLEWMRNRTTSREMKKNIDFYQQINIQSTPMEP